MCIRDSLSAADRKKMLLDSYAVVGSDCIEVEKTSRTRYIDVINQRRFGISPLKLRCIKLILGVLWMRFGLIQNIDWGSGLFQQ